MANVVILSGTIVELGALMRDSTGKEWVNFKLKIMQNGSKDSIIPCSASGDLALKLESSFYPNDKVEVTGVVASNEKTSKVGNVYYELKIFAQKVLNFKDFGFDNETYTQSNNKATAPQKQANTAYSYIDIADDELPF